MKKEIGTVRVRSHELGTCLQRLARAQDAPASCPDFFLESWFSPAGLHHQYALVLRPRCCHADG